MLPIRQATLLITLFVFVFCGGSSNSSDMCAILKRERAVNVSEDQLFASRMLPFYHNRTNRAKFWYCLVPKTGCTQWMALRMFMTTGVHRFARSNHVRVERERARSVGKGEWTDVPRIIVVRNPYTRFLSAYLQRQTHNFTMLEVLDKVSTDDFPDMHHFGPMSGRCNVEYDYVFKLEQMALWWDCFVDLVDLHEIAKEMNTRRTTPFLSTDPEACPFGTECYLRALIGRNSWPMLREKVGHEQNTKALDLPQDVVAKITEVYKQDFVTFGYPLWDGLSEMHLH